MFGSDFNGRWREGRAVIATAPLLPSPFFWASLTSLIKIYYSPDSSAAVNIGYGGSDFHQENTEYPLTKITPVLQVSWLKFHWLTSINTVNYRCLTSLRPKGDFFSFDVTPLFCRCFLFQAIRELILFHTEDRTLCMCNIWFRTVSYSSWIALVKRALWLSVLQPKPKSCTDNEISNRRENTKNQVVIGW